MFASSFWDDADWLLTKFGAVPAKTARRATMITRRTVRRMTTRIKFRDQENSLSSSKYYRCGTSRLKNRGRRYKTFVVVNLKEICMSLILEADSMFR